MNKKYSFKNDYSEGAHKKILDALASTNFLQCDGYGKDDFCEAAKVAIREKLDISDCDIHFLTGGTLVNKLVIGSFLKPYESAVSAKTGHINVHETGAIEATGHKINIVNSDSEKLTPEYIGNIVKAHTDEHMVKPKLVYISNATECGTIYSYGELKNLSEYCKANDLLLYMDGARLAQALSSPDCDYSLAEIHNFFDAYYIGGTKNGCLIGEALIINNDKFKENFRYYIKQSGALLAKGRLLGVQFLELFRDNLFFELGKIAVENAISLADKLKSLGVTFRYKPQTNQIFPIFSNDLIEHLLRFFDFYVWENIDRDCSVVRLVTSWATPCKQIDNFYEKVLEFYDEKGR
ncbi:threonine aldolase [Deferribacterales bacterium Es71-Z0220]|uniref:threonine aldolase family protein n=1 Tax=Deferrivibrio essentukiensis TaxID=2880922 RepID=UPI001F61ED3C|nr:beta-eliminating lyase-related protein [Deferrivibrio essentukiensis]MCB4204432.1 threonine aldolase [Deferrivibrio essentukiensis]